MSLRSMILVGSCTGMTVAAVRLLRRNRKAMVTFIILVAMVRGEYEKSWKGKSRRLRIRMKRDSEKK